MSPRVESVCPENITQSRSPADFLFCDKSIERHNDYDKGLLRIGLRNRKGKSGLPLCMNTFTEVQVLMQAGLPHSPRKPRILNDAQELKKY
jgi:hypothetical protein